MEQECNRFPCRNSDNNGKRNNDRGGSTSQQDPMQKCKPDDVIRAIDCSPRGKKTGKPQDQFDKILTTKSVQSIQRVTTRCLSAQSYTSPSSLHCQMHPRRSPTRRMTMMTKKTLTGSRNPKTWSMSYLEGIQASPDVPKSHYSGRSSQLSLQFKDP